MKKTLVKNEKALHSLTKKQELYLARQQRQRKIKYFSY